MNDPRIRDDSSANPRPTAEKDVGWHLHERCGVVHRDDACPTPHHAMNEHLIPVTSEIDPPIPPWCVEHQAYNCQHSRGMMTRVIPPGVTEAESEETAG